MTKTEPINTTSSDNHEKKELDRVDDSLLDFKSKSLFQYLKPGLKLILISICFIFLVIFIILGIAGYKAYQYTQTFFKIANTDYYELKEKIEFGLSTVPENKNQIKHFLILGLDSLETRGDPPLTDVVMLASINFNTSQINLVSLPRDLWNDAYKTKINALYSYSIDRNPDDPTAFIESVIEEWTQLPVHHTLVITMDQLSEFVDSLDSVEVNIDESFVDDKFPDPNIDVDIVSDPNLLYKTVAFEAGTENMNGERVLEYIRSRHAEGETGTDDNRQLRQQAVIEAIARKMLTREVVLNPKATGSIFNWYQQSFEVQFPLTQAISTLSTLLKSDQSISLESHSLSISKSDGVISHPPTSQSDGLWIYQVNDTETFRAELSNYLEGSK